MSVVWLRQPVAALIVALAVLPVGCGRSGSSSAPTPAEARFVTLFNAICRKTYTGRAERPPTAAETATLRSFAKSAGGAPRVAQFKSDLAAQRKLRVALGKLPRQGGFIVRRGGPDVGSYIDQVYRLNVKLYGDEKALGLTSCLGRPPRKPIGG